MPIIKEFRIPLPVTVEEYHVAQLYAVLHASKEFTEGQTAVEVLENRPFENEEMGKGQFTHKIYHIGNKFPKIIRALCPASALRVDEKAWNAYPHCKTIVTNPFLGERFEIVIETVHLPDAGTSENALNLDAGALKKRKVQLVDIGKDLLTGSDAEANEQHDPATFKSEKTGRGPLVGDWIDSSQPVMCAYKLVTAKFEVFGLQGKVESFIEGTEGSIFLKFHKQLFTLIDEWYGLSMADIRKLEEEAKAELDTKLDGMNLESRDKKLIKGADHPLLKAPAEQSQENAKIASPALENNRLTPKRDEASI